ncbi:Polyubiquitin (Fragment) [Linum perenne]
MKEVVIVIVSYSREFLLEITDQEPVLDIKSKIEHLLGIPAQAQTLSVSGWELIDGLDMEDYPIINHGTKIDLEIKPNYLLLPSHQFSLTIKLPSMQSFTVQVDRSDTVRSLEEKIISSSISVEVELMSLYCSGVELVDEFRNLSEYGIHECSEIVVVLLKNKGTVNFVVKTSSCLLNGASIPVEMKDSGSVSELREVLLGSKIVPEDDYIFIYRQRIMRDCCSLRWHGVLDGDVVYLFKGSISRGSH